jgi:hypothetical protein
MKSRLLIGLAVAIVAIAAVTVSLSVYQHRNGTPEISLLSANVEALSNDEGTPASSCARTGGPSCPYEERMYCNSQTNSDTIYPCPTSSRMDYYSSMDRCTK